MVTKTKIGEYFKDQEIKHWLWAVTWTVKQRRSYNRFFNRLDATCCGCLSWIGSFLTESICLRGDELCVWKCYNSCFLIFFLLIFFSVYLSKKKKSWSKNTLFPKGTLVLFLLYSTVMNPKTVSWLFHWLMLLAL